MVTKWSPTPPFALGQDPKGMLAGPGTPRNPKSYLFVTKWVAVAPFGTWGPRPGAEFRCESRQGGPAPLNLNFVSPCWSQKMPACTFFAIFLKMDCPSQGGFGPQGAPRGPCWGVPVRAGYTGLAPWRHRFFSETASAKKAEANSCKLATQNELHLSG